MCVCVCVCMCVYGLNLIYSPNDLDNGPIGLQQ